MRSGDYVRRQGRIGQMIVDEGSDAQQQGLMTCIRGGRVLTELFGDDGGKQVHHIAGKHLADLGPVRSGLGGQLGQEGHRDRGQALLASDRSAGDAPQIVLRQPEHAPRQSEDRLVVAEKVERVWPRGVVEGELARRQGGCPPVLDHHTCSPTHQADQQAFVIGLGDQTAGAPYPLRDGIDCGDLEASQAVGSYRPGEEGLRGNNDVRWHKYAPHHAAPVVQPFPGQYAVGGENHAPCTSLPEDQCKYASRS